MTPGLGLALVICVVIVHFSTSLIILHDQTKALIINPQRSQTVTPRKQEIDEETPRFYMDTMKSALTRIIKYYRRMKPEIKIAMCFSRYVGIVPGVRRARRADCGRGQCGDRAMSMIPKNRDQEVTLKGLLQDIVHVVMLFLSDLTPQPMSTMMKMASEMWNTTRTMYNSMRQDEMGSCFIDYTSHRFWWWMGI